MSDYVKFQYMPLEGKITGKQVLEQTEDAINDLGNKVYSMNLDESDIQEALDKSQEAIDIANGALEVVTDHNFVWYNNVAEMVDAQLESGVVAATKGYYLPNDGGSGFYSIRTKQGGDVDDGGSIIFLDNNDLVAQLFTDGFVTVKQFGAIGDGVEDDTTAFENTASFASTNSQVPMIPPSTYKVTSTVSGTFGTVGTVTITGGGTVDVVNFKDEVDEASEYADLAKKWANYTSGVVADGEYSAKKYSQDSASYATASANSATNAASSASTAQTTASALTTFLETKETLTAPAVDATLSVSGAAADAKVTGDEIKSTTAEMSLFGVDDLLWDNTSPVSKTQNGITWTVDAVTKNVTISGTSTGASVLVFLGYGGGFPSWLQKGKTYYAHLHTNADVSFQVQKYTGSQTTIAETKNVIPFVVPNDNAITGLVIRLYIASGKTVNTVVRPFISESLNLREEQENIDKLGFLFPVWSSGGVNTATGNDYSDTKRIRSNYIPVTPGEELVAIAPPGVGMLALFYDSDVSYDSFYGEFNSTIRTITIPAGVSMVRWQARDYANDIAITPDFGNQVKTYRTSEAIYKALENLSVQYIGMEQSRFSSIDNLPLSSLCRILASWLDEDTETLPMRGVTEYYILTLGRPTDGITKSQLAFDFANSIFYTRNYALGVWSGWVRVGETCNVEYTSAMLTENTYIKLNYQSLSFNKNSRLLSSPDFSCILIPVKKGDIIYLRTTGGSLSALPYCMVKQNYVIDYIYSDAITFKGTIVFPYDGFLGVNVTNASKQRFKLIQTFFNAESVNASRFVNALKNTNNELPEYDEHNVGRVLNTGASMMGSIHHWGIVGASYDCGELNYMVNGVQKEIEWQEYSCWERLKLLNDIPDLYIYADGGQNAKEWITLGANTTRGYAYSSDTEEVNPYSPNGRIGIGHFGGCWWKMLADHNNGDTKQAFVINLGGNDINSNYPHDADWNTLETYDTSRYYECGTTADIGTYDLDTNTDTVPAGKTAGVVPGIVNSFCAYMGAIINRLLAIQPDGIVFVATQRVSSGTINANKWAIWQEYNQALRDICELPQYDGHVYLIDMAEYGDNYATSELAPMTLGDHPNAIGYQHMAFSWNTLIDHAIMKIYKDHRQTMYIGTVYSY